MRTWTNVILHEGGKALAQTTNVSESGNERHTGWTVLEPGIEPRHYTLFSDALNFMRPVPPAVLARKKAHRAQSAASAARRKAS